MRRANDRCLNGFIYVTLPGGVRAGVFPRYQIQRANGGKSSEKRGAGRGNWKKIFEKFAN